MRKEHISAFRGSTALVTGASGFVGTCLVRTLLDSGCRVGIIVRPTSSLWRVADILDRVSTFKTDVTDIDKVRDVFRSLKPDYVFHLATHGAYGFQADSVNIMRTNIVGTLAVLECIREMGCERLVVTGSSSEYGIVDGPMREDMLPEPINVYGAAKVAVSTLTQTYFRVHRIPTAVLRLFSVYGPYEEPTRFIASLIVAALRGKTFKLTKGEQERDFVFMDDVISACLLAATSPQIIGEIINVGSGTQHAIRDVGETIMRLMGNPIKLEWGALPYREGEMWRWQADISKARKVLGWTPRFDLTAGLRRTIEWFTQNQYLFEEASDVHAPIRDPRHS